MNRDMMINGDLVKHEVMKSHTDKNSPPLMSKGEVMGVVRVHFQP